MKVLRRTVGPLQANAYLMVDPASNEAVLVDPGDEATLLIETVRSEGAALKAVWLTHAHFDHVGALAEIAEHYRVPVYVHERELPLLAAAATAAALWGIAIRQPVVDTTPISDSMSLLVGQIEARCLFTPGHSPGHIAFSFPDQHLVLSGDTLFRGSIGRTDLPGGDYETLLSSLHHKLLTLPEDTVVWPGHGLETTVGTETRTNPFLAPAQP